MYTTNRLPLTDYMQCRFYCVIHLNVPILQKINFGQRCVSKYLCRVAHSSHHNKKQATLSKQICCELVMLTPNRPCRHYVNYIATFQLVRDRKIFISTGINLPMQGRISVVLIMYKSGYVFPIAEKNI